MGQLFGARFDGPLTSLGSKRQPLNHLLKRRVSPSSVRSKKMHPGMFMGYVLRAWEGWSGYLLIADCEVLEKLVSLRTSLKGLPTQEAQENSVFSWCGRISQTLLQSSSESRWREAR